MWMIEGDGAMAGVFPDVETAIRFADAAGVPRDRLRAMTLERALAAVVAAAEGSEREAYECEARAEIEEAEQEARDASSRAEREIRAAASATEDMRDACEQREEARAERQREHDARAVDAERHLAERAALGDEIASLRMAARAADVLVERAETEAARLRDELATVRRRVAAALESLGAALHGPVTPPSAPAPPEAAS